MKYENILDTIGKTPLVELQNLKKELHLKGNVIAKVEFFNPGGSVKDRIAFAMIEDGIKKGLINQDTVIIEPTSGNTGIGLAMVAASKGLKAIIVMPESMSIERRKLMKAYGAELVLTEASKGMAGAAEKANQLHQEIPNSFIPSQFTNLINPKTHYSTTAKEIYEDMNGYVDIFVAGVGTGGTVSGIGKYLKEKNKNVKVYAVEPLTSPLLSEGHAGPHKIQGIGANFIPETLDTSIYDQVITVSNEDAIETAKLIAKKEGILVGISSGAALFAAIQLAKLEENKDKNIVVLLPDTGERYISTPLFE